MSPNEIGVQMQQMAEQNDKLRPLVEAVLSMGTQLAICQMKLEVVTVQLQARTEERDGLAAWMDHLKHVIRLAAWMVKRKGAGGQTITREDCLYGRIYGREKACPSTILAARDARVKAQSHTESLTIVAKCCAYITQESRCNNPAYRQGALDLEMMVTAELQGGPATSRTMVAGVKK